ncbi:hypothetical protein [Nitrosococcus wardiae]|nr:hypothetical protein [Nitrosococcus wardiae]
MYGPEREVIFRQLILSAALGLHLIEQGLRVKAFSAAALVQTRKL